MKIPLVDEVAKMKKYFLLCAALLLTFTVSIAGQKDWEKVPYTEWTKNQVSALLSDSAWVKTVDFQQEGVNTQQLGMLTAPPVKSKITLRSALPIRQALMRKRQLESKYDSMKEAERTAFDTKNKALLDCPACKAYYVVTVESRGLAMENKNYVSDRKDRVYLSNDAGDKRILVEFAVLSQNESELVFYFPRANDKGEPLVTISTKKLTFNFELRGLDGKSRFPFEKFSFNVADMIRDGELML